jgi:hypothetical protein
VKPLIVTGMAIVGMTVGMVLGVMFASQDSSRLDSMVFGAVIGGAIGMAALTLFANAVIFRPAGATRLLADNVRAQRNAGEQADSSDTAPVRHGVVAPPAHPVAAHASPVEPSRLTRCPDCEGIVSRRARTCPHCGCPLIDPA